jgi:hypothetical protein
MVSTRYFSAIVRSRQGDFAAARDETDAVRMDAP